MAVEAEERYEIRQLPTRRVLATATTLAGAELAVQTLSAECGPLDLAIYDRERHRTVMAAAHGGGGDGAASRSDRQAP